ncbi:MAG: leucine-rich repeat domain-containing protein [Promethearchaeota archaeon]
MTKKSKIKADQAMALKDLESLIGKQIPQVKKTTWTPYGFTWDAFGFKVEGDEVIELGLHNCELPSLPESIGNLTSLKKISLIVNRITFFPKSLKRLIALQYLNLGANNLTTLPEIICDLISLKELDLGNNNLTSLPKCISNLKSLEMLNFEGNNLETLPESISHLKSLKILKLGLNQINILPESIFYLESLRNLQLKENNIENLPESVGNLISLEKLDLSNNNLASLPDSISNLSLLEKLVLVENDLTILPESFWKLKNLRTIDLSGNKWKGEWKEMEKNDIPTVLKLSRKLNGINIFISHAWVDQEKYRIIDLKRYLEDKILIHEVDVCEEDLVGDIWEFMAENVPKSHLLLFIATDNSKTSSACLYELSLAKKYGVKILPIKEINDNWEKFNRLDLNEYNQDFIDLSTLGGLEFDFNIDNIDEFSSIYEYIRENESELKSFKKKKELIEKATLNIKDTIFNFIKSIEFRENLKKNYKEFENIFQEESNNQISSLEYFYKWAQILKK